MSGQVGDADLVCAIEVGDGAGELENAVVGAGAQVELGDGPVEERANGGVGLAVLANLVRNSAVPMSHGCGVMESTVIARCPGP